MEIWKTVLSIIVTQDIIVPTGAQMLCAREQYGEVCVWYLCDPTNAMELRKIILVGTGHTVPEPSPDRVTRYLGTASLDGGSLMFHVFEA